MRHPPAALHCCTIMRHQMQPDLTLVLHWAQYDLSVSTFSPDGRVFQTDYAQKAADNSG